MATRPTADSLHSLRESASSFDGERRTVTFRIASRRCQYDIRGLVTAFQASDVEGLLSLEASVGSLDSRSCSTEFHREFPPGVSPDWQPSSLFFFEWIVLRLTQFAVKPPGRWTR